MIDLIEKFEAINHYQKYPILMPWVGEMYFCSEVKYLLVGESHFLEQTSTCHLDAEAWYRGVDLFTVKASELDCMNTAQIIRRGIKNKWKLKSRAIYRNLTHAMEESGVELFQNQTPFEHIAFLNYFQRPAEKVGKSIKENKLDKEISSYVIGEVINILKPDAVVFSSAKAFKSAQSSGLLGRLNDRSVEFVRLPHAACSWWNRNSKVNNHTTGKRKFIHFLKFLELRNKIGNSVSLNEFEHSLYQLLNSVYGTKIPVGKASIKQLTADVNHLMNLSD